MVGRGGGAYRFSSGSSDPTVFVGNFDGRISALSAASGSTRWQTTLDGPIQRPPAVEEDRVYVEQFFGDLVALDRNTGKIQWNYEMEGGDSRPVAADGVVYTGSRRGEVIAVEGQSGGEVGHFGFEYERARRPRSSRRGENHLRERRPCSSDRRGERLRDMGP
ncbi:PQQ-binding-like beta-propeller repeat protein [Halosimplex aquaticum]